MELVHVLLNMDSGDLFPFVLTFGGFVHLVPILALWTIRGDDKLKAWWTIGYLVAIAFVLFLANPMMELGNAGGWLYLLTTLILPVIAGVHIWRSAKPPRA